MYLLNSFLLKRFLHFIISHAIWVAICAASLVFQTTQLLQLPADWYLITFVFCATLCSYNFHYILAGGMADKKLSIDLLYKRPLAVYILLAGIAGALVTFYNTGISFINVMTAALLTFFYSIPLLPFKQVAFTRKAGFLKTLLLAFTWMFVTAYLPLAQHGLQFTTPGILILAKRFLFMVMLCIIFDNRDVAVDKVHGLHSLATDLPSKIMRALISTVFILLFTLNFFIGKNGIPAKQVLALQVSALATLGVYFYSRQKRGYFFYYFIVDGMMVLMVLLTSIASI